MSNVSYISAQHEHCFSINPASSASINILQHCHNCSVQKDYEMTLHSFDSDHVVATWQAKTH